MGGFYFNWCIITTMIHNPEPLRSLRTKSKPTPNPNKEYFKSLSRLEKMAILVTDRIGTMGFFVMVLSWTVFWLIWNILAPMELRFDPYPAFVMWLFISNMIQILLMPLIMIGQNLQNRHAERRAEADFEVNLKAEKEIETILQHLENQNESIVEILKRLENK